MKPFRKERLESLILKQLSYLIEKNLEFDNSLVTLIKGELDEELKEIKIYFSVFPNEKENKLKCFKILEDSKKELEKELFKKLKIKYLPKISFLFYKEYKEN